MKLWKLNKYKLIVTCLGVGSIVAIATVLPITSCSTVAPVITIIADKDSLQHCEPENAFAIIKTTCTKTKLPVTLATDSRDATEGTDYTFDSSTGILAIANPISHDGPSKTVTIIASAKGAESISKNITLMPDGLFETTPSKSRLQSNNDTITFSTTEDGSNYTGPVEYLPIDGDEYIQVSGNVLKWKNDKNKLLSPLDIKINTVIAGVIEDTNSITLAPNYTTAQMSKVQVGDHLGGATLNFPSNWSSRNQNISYQLLFTNSAYIQIQYFIASIGDSGDLYFMNGQDGKMFHDGNPGMGGWGNNTQFKIPGSLSDDGYKIFKITEGFTSDVNIGNIQMVNYIPNFD